MPQETNYIKINKNPTRKQRTLAKPQTTASLQEPHVTPGATRRGSRKGSSEQPGAGGGGGTVI